MNELDLPLKEMLDDAILNLTMMQFAVTGFCLHPNTFSVEWNDRMEEQIFMSYRNIPIYLSKDTPIGELDFRGYSPARSFRSIEGKGS